MSGPSVSGPRSREMQILRVLFDRHLLDRAVNLAEARWAGSGDMVRLAYAWPELSPAERRQRLAEIGPQKLAEFRAFADLHPELTQVLDELEAQGVLAPDPVGLNVAPDPDPPPTPAEPETVAAEPVEAVDIPTASESSDGGLPTPIEDIVLDEPALREIEMPDLESGVESVDEFLAAERQRRAAAVASGAEMLERVRARLDQTARKVTSTTSTSPAPMLPAYKPVAIPAASTGNQTAVAVDDGRFVAPSEEWLDRLREERVIVVGPGIMLPSDDELVALANELSIGFVEFVLEPGATRSLFGGLTRANGVVGVGVGPLPSAMAKPNLVIIQGRLYAKALDRLRAGYCDIPGTRATVKIDPATRVLIVNR